MTLTRFELRWAEAALSAMFPSRAHPRLEVGIADLPLAAYLRDLFAELPLRAAWGLRVSLWICALAPLVVLRRARLLSSLDLPSRTRVLAALLESRRYAVRQLVALWKVFGAMLYATAPAVRAVMMPRAVPIAAQSGPRLIELGRKARVARDDAENAASAEMVEVQRGRTSA